MNVLMMAPMVAVFSLLALPGVRAEFLIPAPSLTVHESHYGIGLNGEKRESVQSIQIRLLSSAEPGKRFQVQSFFFKKGRPGGIPRVDDTVIFDTVNPHATYQVAARSIPLSGCSKTSASTATSLVTIPRVGFIVRILHDGILIREHCSTHQLQEFAQVHSGTLDRAAAKKSARHLEAKDLLVR